MYVLYLELKSPIFACDCEGNSSGFFCLEGFRWGLISRAGVPSGRRGPHVLFTAPKARWLHLVGSSVLAPEAMPDVVTISPDTRVHRIKISILPKVSEVRTFNESIVYQAPLCWLQIMRDAFFASVKVQGCRVTKSSSKQHSQEGILRS